MLGELVVDGIGMALAPIPTGEFLMAAPIRTALLKWDRNLEKNGARHNAQEYRSGMRREMDLGSHRR